MSDRITTSKLDAMKSAGDKFVMVTAYDSTFARLVSDAGAECILVGDSLGMVLQGHDYHRSSIRWMPWFTTRSVWRGQDPHR